jgi:hypothetical protein
LQGYGFTVNIIIYLTVFRPLAAGGKDAGLLFKTAKATRAMIFFPL